MERIRASNPKSKGLWATNDRRVDYVIEDFVWLRQVAGSNKAHVNKLILHVAMK